MTSQIFGNCSQRMAANLIQYWWNFPLRLLVTESFSPGSVYVLLQTALIAQFTSMKTSLNVTLISLLWRGNYSKTRRSTPHGPIMATRTSSLILMNRPNLAEYFSRMIFLRTLGLVRFTLVLAVTRRL